MFLPIIFMLLSTTTLCSTLYVPFNKPNNNNPFINDHCIHPFSCTTPPFSKICSAKAESTFVNVKENTFLQDKKIISISPGGFLGFYLFGICTYIKENYNTDQYVYTGASAGAWNSLFMSHRFSDPGAFVLDILDETIEKRKSINDVQYFMKEKILQNYKDSDFDLQRLYIGVTTLPSFQPKITIYSDFVSLEDAIDCCIASSHIPFVTGGFINRYHHLLSFDGGFSRYPYLDIAKPVLHISPNMWTLASDKKEEHLIRWVDLFCKGKTNFFELFEKGYNDAKKNKYILDKTLL